MPDSADPQFCKHASQTARRNRLAQRKQRDGKPTEGCAFNTPPLPPIEGKPSPPLVERGVCSNPVTPSD
jgi:hypothetical protein